MTRTRMVSWGFVVVCAAGLAYSGCGKGTIDSGAPRPDGGAGGTAAHPPWQPPPPQALTPFDRTAGWQAFALTAAGAPRQAPIDVLFMVDDSASMHGFQQQLASGFDAFMAQMDGALGGAADLHIGVVSADMGAGDGSISGCMDTVVRGAGGAGGGGEIREEGSDNGRLQAAPRGACTHTTLASGQNFMALGTDPATGARVTNFSASSASDVFSCIAVMGEQGCGFERPFTSVRHALDPALAPYQNAGFLRPDAFLAVVLLTNEDDCSASDAIPLYDVSSNRTLASTLGPPSSFRCNEFGHVCMIDGAMQYLPRAAVGPLEGCRSAEDGRLERVSDFVRFLRSLKRDPAMVFVAALAGPPSPYAVHTKAPPIADGPWPEMTHSCTTGADLFADPAVRINELTTSLGARGAFESICAGDLAAPLQRIARAMTRPLATACVARPSSPGSCQVVDRWVDGQGQKRLAALSACADAGSATPCWSLADDAACDAGSQRLTVRRDGTTLPSPEVMTAIDCSGAPLAL